MAAVENRTLSINAAQGREHDAVFQRRIANMTHIVVNPVVPKPISPEELLPWTFFVGLILLMVLYFVGAEQGASSLIEGDGIHEFVHDSRHLLGFPCH